MKWQRDIGSGPSSTGHRLTNYPKLACGSKDNRKYARRLDERIIKYLRASQERYDSRMSSALSERDTGKQLEAVQQTIMSIRFLRANFRMTPLWPTPDLNLEENHSDGTMLQIGNLSVHLQKQVTSTQSLPTFTFAITSPSNELLGTMLDRLLWKGPAMCSGVLQGLGNHIVPGMKPELTLTLKTLEQNGTLFMTIGGVVTGIKSMLSSMSFEAVLTLHTCSDGSTDTLSWWKLKEGVDLFEQQRFGSLLTWIPVNGTQN